MGIFTGVLLASDLDGTLLHSSGVVSKGNRAAISYFISEGGLFAPATGRSLLGFQKLRRELECNAPCVFSNGAYIYDCAQEKELYSDPLCGPYRELLEDLLESTPHIGIEIHQPKQKYLLNRNQYIEGHLNYVGAKGQDVSHYRQAPFPWLKLLLVDDPELLEGTARRLLARYGKDFSIAFSLPFMLEIQNIETDKGTGVAKLAEILHIRPENVYTAGDAPNDLPMLTRFESFAPENALPEVKNAAYHIMPHHDEDMIAAVVNFLKERRCP